MYACMYVCNVCIMYPRVQNHIFKIRDVKDGQGVKICQGVGRVVKGILSLTV